MLNVTAKGGKKGTKSFQYNLNRFVPIYNRLKTHDWIAPPKHVVIEILHGNNSHGYTHVELFGDVEIRVDHHSL